MADCCTLKLPMAFCSSFFSFFVGVCFFPLLLLLYLVIYTTAFSSTTVTVVLVKQYNYIHVLVVLVK